MWVSARELVCSTKLGEPVAWRCRRIAGAVALADFEETEAGALWAATEQAGIHRWNETRAAWEVIEPSLHLASRDMLGLARSPRGGMWILGHGIVLRVRETPDGWQVLEAPSSWNGMPAVDGLDVARDKRWHAVGRRHRGRADPGARPWARATATAARAHRRSVDGEVVDPGRRFEPPYGRNLLQVGFAALSYRDPG